MSESGQPDMTVRKFMCRGLGCDIDDQVHFFTESAARDLDGKIKRWHYLHYIVTFVCDSCTVDGPSSLGATVLLSFSFGFPSFTPTNPPALRVVVLGLEPPLKPLKPLDSAEA